MAAKRGDKAGRNPEKVARALNVLLSAPSTAVVKRVNSPEAGREGVRWGCESRDQRAQGHIPYTRTARYVGRVKKPWKTVVGDTEGNEEKGDGERLLESLQCEALGAAHVHNDLQSAAAWPSAVTYSHLHCWMHAPNDADLYTKKTSLATSLACHM